MEAANAPVKVVHGYTLATEEARMAERQASGIAGDLERDLGGGGDDDGERAGPETARQDEEPGGQLTGQFFGHHGVANEDGQGTVRFAPFGLKHAGDGA